MAPPFVVVILLCMEELQKGQDKFGADQLERTGMGHQTPGFLLLEVLGVEFSGLLV